MSARPTRVAAIVAGSLVAAAIAYAALVTGQVLLGRSDEPPADADAIIVLGAAQYDGVPSPALAARLAKARTLWSEQVAPLIVVTGGGKPGDRFNEATAGRTWLHQRGVPEEAILREVQGRSSYEQLAATARFLREDGLSRVVLVSHRLHATRLRLIADEVGLEASVSAVDPSAATWRGRAELAAREIAAVAAGQVIGFRRLHNLLAGDPG